MKLLDWTLARGRILRLGAVIVACAPFIGVGSGPASVHARELQSGPIGVVAAENFWGDIVGQLGGSHVAVTSIISDPSADPHEYESNVDDARAIAESQLVIINGAGYDSFVPRLLSASPNSSRTVITVADLVGKQQGDNPHMWYNLSYASTAADAFTAALQRLDPADSDEFASRNQTFKASLQPIRDEITAISAGYAGTHVAETERVAGYMIDAIGLKVDEGDFQHAIEEGNDPSPQSVENFTNQLDNRAVAVLFYNSQTVTPITENMRHLAESDGVPIIGVSETEPPGKNYQQWQLGQLMDLLAALGG